MTNKLLCTYDAHAVFAVGDAALDLPAAASKCKVDSHQCIACTMCIIVQCCLRELLSFTHKLPTTAVLFCLNWTGYQVPLCSWSEPRVQTACRWSTYLAYFHTQFKDLCLFIKYSTFPACVLWDTVIFNFNLLTSQNITTDHIYQVLTFCAFCYRDQGRHGTGGQTDGRKATLNVLDATLPPVERLVMFTPKQHIKHRAYIYKKLTRRWDSERELFTTTS